MNVHSLTARCQLALRVQGFKGFKGSRVHLGSEVHLVQATGVVGGATAVDVGGHFTELIAWQRADALERFALDMIKRPALAADETFCQQTTDCAASAPRNIAEGHGRFAPPQFANFLRIAIASEQETRNQIIKAWQRGGITDEEKREGLVLSKRALAAAVRLRHYLLTAEARANARAIEHRSTRRAKCDT